MNTEHKLIKLYRTRTFSEKMSDTFDFVRENLRILLKYITYLLLPVALVQTFCMTNFMTGYLQTINVMVSGKSNPAEMASWMLSMALMVLVMYVGMILLVAMVYSMMQLYEQRPGLQGITFADIKTSFFRMSGRQLVLLVTNIVFYLVFALIIVVMVAISPYMILPAVVLSIVVMPLLVLVYPVYLFETMGVISAYAKGIRLGWKTWGLGTS